jgi:hypothetical protein
MYFVVVAGMEQMCADGARDELSKDNKASSCGFVKRRTKNHADLALFL